MSLSLERLAQLSPKQLALLAVELQERLDAAEWRRQAPIAVIGIGCRFPGGIHSPEDYWRLLEGGVDAITEVRSDRWDADAYFDPDPNTPGRMSTRWGGFVEAMDRFDPEFFGIAPREAVGMDPQQRWLLEVAWEALERAGQAPEQLVDSRTGVFVGISGWDYHEVCKAAGGEAGMDAYSASGAAHSVAAGRLSYVLGLRGPNLAVDTACSSSLVAVHLAVQSLRRGECDLALAGGVNAILTPDTGIALSKLGMMAPDGRCKVFDAAADGFVRSEGCGVIVLRRVSDAIARRDPVVALIRGTAINHDGRSNGLTAPNGPAQVAVLRAALADAGVDPASIGFVEAHGTGTALGDPIEVQALGEVYGTGRTRPLLAGSVKSNIGHLESAAGIAGLIKAVLVLAKATVPPHLHLQNPSPYIPWHRLPVKIPTDLTPWPPADGPRRAAVSSFGFSGTNAHAVLEAAPVAPAPSDPDRPKHVFTLSARSESALRALAGRYAADPAVTAAPLADVCFTAAAGRSHLVQRMAFTVQASDTLRDTLEAIASGAEPAGLHRGHARAARPPKVAFLFSGQGAQYAGMGRQLYATQPTFKQTVDRCDAMLRAHLERPLLDVLYPQAGDAAAAAYLDDTTYTQAAIFTVGYALAELWRAWGLAPAWVMGHSVGELVAACVAGCFSLEDGLRLIAIRGQLMGALPPGGAMAAVFADPDGVRAAIAPHAQHVAIAALNGPDNTVISGPADAVDAIVVALAAQGVQARRLKVSHAFHSPLMEPMLDAWTAAVAGLSWSAPSTGLVSNVTGRPVTAAEIGDPAYWRCHAREPVRFADGVRALREQGCDAFVEIGPSPVLLGMAGRCIADEGVVWLPSLRQGRDDWATILESVAELHVRGAPIDWEGFDRDHPRQRICLPTYPFEGERYWVAAGPFRPAATATIGGQTASGAVPREADGRLERRPPSATERVADLLYAVAWRPLKDGRWGTARLVAGDVGSGQPPASDASPIETPASTVIAERLTALVERLRVENALERHDRLLREMDALAIAYTAHALRRLGWDFAVGETVTAATLGSRLGIVPRCHRLLGRLLQMLAEEGYLQVDPSGWRVQAQPPEVDPGLLWASAAAAFPNGETELALLGRCGAHMAEALHGDADPLQLLFPDGSLAEAERLYQDAPAARTFNALVGEALAAIAADWPAGRPLRILEIGGGTGGTTSWLLPWLPADRTDYTFTDVSPRFTTHAAEKFSRYPFVTYRVLDIAADPGAQGFTPQAFDVVIAANVLHATPDLRRSLAHLRWLLAPNGRLLLLEVTRPTRFGDLTVGLTDGWWAFDDPDLRPDYAALSRERWVALLAEQGFEDAVAVPDATDGVLAEQAVVVARRRAGSAAADRARDTWLILADTGGLGDGLADRLRSNGDRCVIATGGAAYAGAGEDRFVVDPTSGTDLARLVRAATANAGDGRGGGKLAGVIYLWGLDADVSDDAPASAVYDVERRAVGGALHVVQALLRDGPMPPPRLWLVTRGAQSIPTAAGGGTAVSREGPVASNGGSGGIDDGQGRSAAVAQAPLWGFGQVVEIEHPELGCTRVDLDPNESLAGDLAAVLAVVTGDEGHETALALRQGRGFVPRLVRWTPGARDHDAWVAPSFRPDATYLITGGLGGLGLAVARWLAEHGARHLVLIGRGSGEPGGRGSKAGADAIGRRPEIQASIEAIEALGASVRLRRADVADREQLAAVLDGIAADLPPLRGIVHAAGVLADAALLQQSWDRFAAVMAPKVGGTWQIVDLTRNLRLDFVALFSSGAAVLGSAGQANHAAANAFLDAMAGRLRAAGVAAISIQWGPWAEVGAAARTRSTLRSVVMITPSAGLAAMGVALREAMGVGGARPAQLAVLPLDAANLQLRVNASGLQPLLAELKPPADGGTRSGDHGPDLCQALLASPPNRRFAALLGRVRMEAAAVLGAGGDRTLDTETPLSEMGLDSLMAVELRNRLSRAAGQSLPATLLYEHPTILALANHLYRDVLALADAGSAHDPGGSEAGQQRRWDGADARYGASASPEEALDARLWETIGDLEEQLKVAKR